MGAPLSKDLRERIIKLREQGKTQEQIAEQLLIMQSSVSRILKRHRLMGHLKTTKPPGRPRTMTADDDKLLTELVAKTPGATLEELANSMSEEVGKAISSSIIFSALKRLKITRKKRHSMTQQKILKKPRNVEKRS